MKISSGYTVVPTFLDEQREMYALFSLIGMNKYVKCYKFTVVILQKNCMQFYTLFISSNSTFEDSDEQVS